MEAVPDLTQRRDALAAARDALTDVSSVLWQAAGTQLGPLLREVDDLGRLVEAARVAIVGEALARGEMRSACAPPSTLDDANRSIGGDRGERGEGTGERGDGTGERGDDSSDGTGVGTAAGAVPAGTVDVTEVVDVVAAGLVGVAWIQAWAPSLRSGGATRLLRLAERLRSRDGDRLREAVLSGRVGVGNASVCAQEMDRLQPRLCPEAVPSVWDALIELAAAWGPREVRALRPRLLADYGREGELQDEQDRAARQRCLSQPRDGGDGLYDYLLRLDAEGKAVLEAALGPLSAPRPAEGVADLRGSDRRRADALLELVRRSVACPDGVPTVAKAQLFLTVDILDLIAGLKAATTVGGSDAGTLLAPETARRMACDAQLLPTVMAGPSHVLDLGRATRPFSPAQVKVLWLRDRHCTIPGCTVPAQWCDGHHLVHWADGGPTDLGNATLLCGYHHTWVHDHRLAGRVTDDGHVAWDLAPGSYDQRHRP